MVPRRIWRSTPCTAVKPRNSLVRPRVSRMTSSKGKTRTTDDLAAIPKPNPWLRAQQPARARDDVRKLLSGPGLWVAGKPVAENLFAGKPALVKPCTDKVW